MKRLPSNANTTNHWANVSTTFCRRLFTVFIINYPAVWNAAGTRKKNQPTAWNEDWLFYLPHFASDELISSKWLIQVHFASYFFFSLQNWMLVRLCLLRCLVSVRCSDVNMNLFLHCLNMYLLARFLCVLFVCRTIL